MICGVDEAGKGAVIGPMVIAAVGCESEGELRGAGIRDSKKLTRTQRERLCDLIAGQFSTAVIIVTPEEIDLALNTRSLNICVAHAHAEAINLLGAEETIADACDVNAARYAERVRCLLNHPCRITAEHKADECHAIVGAASIVAKVTRDRLIDDLKREYGDIGSGYPSDPTTIAFLKEHIRRHGKPPVCARANWKTVIRLVRQRGQTTLGDMA